MERLTLTILLLLAGCSHATQPTTGSKTGDAICRVWESKMPKWRDEDTELTIAEVRELQHTWIKVCDDG